MEPTMQNNPNNEAAKTVWITIGAIIIIILLIWGGVYMYDHRPSTTGNDMNATTSVATTSVATTTYNLGEDNRPVTDDERAAVAAYLQAHIDDLSTQKPAAGKTFTVTNVNVEGAGRATVEYTDGEKSLAAAISYSLDASGNIVVNTFDILEK